MVKRNLPLMWEAHMNYFVWKAKSCFAVRK
jgi:hypothetical protein